MQKQQTLRDCGVGVGVTRGHADCGEVDIMRLEVFGYFAEVFGLYVEISNEIDVSLWQN